MITVRYQKKYHKKIINACAAAIKSGKVVAYPTDTSYGLAADGTNIKAIKKLYLIKERQSGKPVHVVVPSISYTKKIAGWNKAAGKLAKKFWPGALTLVLKFKIKNSKLKILLAGTGYLGLRMPNNKIALDLAKALGRPITATSANPSAEKSGGYDSYSAKDIVNQFNQKKHQPDIILDAGKLPKRKPSTVVKIFNNHQIAILRDGPISENKIKKILKEK